MSLFEAVKVGALELSNRIVMAPMTRGRSEGVHDMLPSEHMVNYYEQRASAGLIISEGTAISKQAIGWWRSPCIYTDAHVDAWKKVTSAVHAKGGKIVCQLWHTGRASHSDFRPGAAESHGVAPSPIRLADSTCYTPSRKVPYETPRELTVAEIEEIPGEYAYAAKMAMRAGFDGVEIHAANGYLLDEFLQSCTNQRTDQFGGSDENRFRLLGAVVKAVIEECGDGRVGVRLSPHGNFNGMGDPRFREIFPKYAEWLNQYKLAYLHIMIGTGFGFHELGEPLTLEDFSAYEGVIMANCGFTKDTAEKAIGDGHCHLVSFGRLFISNPDLVARFKKGAVLNEQLDPKKFYSSPGENLGKEGLTTYPFMS